MNILPKFKQNGFTLVELLIVIALIGILSVAVLATINPIEQTNKARDAKFKNDAAEVLSAYERYYSAQNAYPWNTNNSGVGTSVSVGTNVAIGSTDVGFGVLGLGNTNGALISTSELKSSFLGKEPFSVAVGAQSIDRMYVYHNGATSTNYVCFHPKAAANRSGTVAANLKCMTTGTDSTATLYDLGSNGCVAATNWTTVVPSATVANLLCVPEGKIN